jgi:hypothetical protein
VSTAQLIAEYKALSPEERQKVAQVILEDESWIPESFAQGMADIQADRTISLDVALIETPPSSVE